MAACTRWKVFFPVLILCVSLLGMAVSVRGDAALIQDVCSKTRMPFYCKTCFEINRKTSQDQNVKDLGRTSIGCASLELEIFRSTLVSHMKSTINLGPGFPNASNRCFSMLTSADRNIKNSLEAWQHGRYESSTEQMWAAVILINDCDEELRMLSLMPKDLADQIVALDGFCRASGGVLSQIH